MTWAQPGYATSSQKYRRRVNVRCRTRPLGRTSTGLMRIKKRAGHALINRACPDEACVAHGSDLFPDDDGLKRLALNVDPVGLLAVFHRVADILLGKVEHHQRNRPIRIPEGRSHEVIVMPAEADALRTGPDKFADMSDGIVQRR